MGRPSTLLYNMVFLAEGTYLFLYSFYSSGFLFLAWHLIHKFIIHEGDDVGNGNDKATTIKNHYFTIIRFSVNLNICERERIFSQFLLFWYSVSGEYIAHYSFQTGERVVDIERFCFVSLSMVNAK